MRPSVQAWLGWTPGSTSVLASCLARPCARGPDGWRTGYPWTSSAHLRSLRWPLRCRAGCLGLELGTCTIIGRETQPYTKPQDFMLWLSLIFALKATVMEVKYATEFTIWSGLGFSLKRHPPLLGHRLPPQSTEQTLLFKHTLLFRGQAHILHQNVRALEYNRITAMKYLNMFNNKYLMN